MNEEQKHGRQYVLLERMEPTEGLWTFHGVVSASSATQAVRDFASANAGTSNDENPLGQLVAVPKRSWNPLSVMVEVERKVRVK
jgi:hypothetical protein